MYPRFAAMTFLGAVCVLAYQPALAAVAHSSSVATDRPVPVRAVGVSDPGTQLYTPTPNTVAGTHSSGGQLYTPTPSGAAETPGPGNYLFTPTPSALPTSQPTPTAIATQPPPTPTTARPTPTPRPTAAPTRPHPGPTGGSGNKRQHRGKHHHHSGSGSSGSSGNTGSNSGSTPGPPSVSLPTVDQLKAEGMLPGNSNIPPDVKRWAYLILPAAHANGIPPAMVAAVITAESSGDPLSWSSADARGLMQIVGGPWDPAANINLGTSMLAGFYNQFGSWKLALAAYNAGPGAVQTYGGVPPYPETENYVVIVQYLYDLYSQHTIVAGAKQQIIKKLGVYRKIAPRIQHLTPSPGYRAPTTAPIGQLVLPDGCDPSGGCRKLPNLRPAKPRSALADPFWPLGTSSDPLPLVSPSGH